jgi:hypothetical protein
LPVPLFARSGIFPSSFRPPSRGPYFVIPDKPVPDLIRESGIQRPRRRAAGLNEDKTLKSLAIKIDNIPRHPGAGRGPGKNNNINLILDTGLVVIPDPDPGRYDEEEMKFHTRTKKV